MTLPWLAWILAATVLPSLPYLLFGKHATDSVITFTILLAMMIQLACSIWLARVLARKGGRNTGFVVAIAVLLVMASIVIGTASFFAACATLGPALNFH